MSPERATVELQRCAGTQFDPKVVDALLACLADPAGVPSGLGVDDMARALTEPVEGTAERRLEQELHALIAIASSVAGAHRLEDVVAVAADAACAAVGAASLSISRWE